MSELWEFGAAALAARIRSKEASSREVVEAHLRRIEEINPTVNAITRVLGDGALEAADGVDRTIAEGGDPGPLGGVPITVKENIDLGGTATTHGLPALAEAVVPGDAPFVGELKRAGAIPIGRTNLPDLASRWHTDNALHGPTLNPWDSERTPGGSSGGEAAALATGMSPLGLGNDIAGSLRWPSQCCGTTALKPSLGRIPFAGHAQHDLPLAFAPQLLAVHGPMARHVADLRLALSHMCSDGNGDPWYAPVPLLGPPLPKRVALVEDPGGRGVTPEIATAVRKAGEALADAGYEIVPRDLPGLQRANEVYFQVMSRLSQATEGPAVGQSLTSDEFKRFWNALAEPFEEAGGAPIHDLMAERRAIALEWDLMFQETPNIVMPVASEPAFKLGSDYDSNWLRSWLVSTRAIVVLNLLGLPAVAVPTHEADGLPHGIQIAAPRFREDLCLDAAEAVEARLGTLSPIGPR